MLRVYTTVRISVGISYYCMVNSSTKTTWNDRWRSGIHGRSYFELQDHPNDVRYKNVSRQDQVLLSRLKFNHFPCQSYLHRFNLSESDICSMCNEEVETVHHIILNCPALKEVRGLDTTLSLCDIFTNQNDEWATICCMLKERSRIHARATQLDA